MVSFASCEYHKPLLTPSAQRILQRHQIDQAGKADADQTLLGVEGIQIAVPPFSWRAWERW